MNEHIDTLRRGSLEPLLQAIRGENKEARIYAIEGLPVIAEELGLGSVALESLLEALTDDDLDIRQSAAIALGSLRNEETARSLLETFAGEDEKTKIWAAIALKRIGPDACMRPLVEALNSEDRKLTRRAAYWLIWLGREEAVVDKRDQFEDWWR